MVRVAPASIRELDGIVFPPHMTFLRQAFSATSLENQPSAGFTWSFAAEAPGDCLANSSSVGVFPCPGVSWPTIGRRMRHVVKASANMGEGNKACLFSKHRARTIISWLQNSQGLRGIEPEIPKILIRKWASRPMIGWSKFHCWMERPSTGSRTALGYTLGASLELGPGV